VMYSPGPVNFMGLNAGLTGQFKKTIYFFIGVGCHYSDRYLTLTFGMKDKTYKVHQTTQYSARHFVEPRSSKFYGAKCWAYRTIQKNDLFFYRRWLCNADGKAFCGMIAAPRYPKIMNNISIAQPTPIKK
jgi:hypothetical protein